MISRREFVAAAACVGLSRLRAPASAAGVSGDDYLSWTLEQVEQIARSTRRTGKVGSRFNERLLKTERAVNYELIATWMTPEVIRATARWHQLHKRLSDSETRQLVADAMGAGDTVFMVELDPREGSGVIPNDWETYLQRKGVGDAGGPSVRGVSTPRLRSLPALAGIDRRNYDYDRFWVVFPLTTVDGQAVFDPSVSEAELITRIYIQEERTYWPVPASVRR